MEIRTNAPDRKAMVKKLAEFTGMRMSYMGPPTFSFIVGQFIIDRAGVITCEDESEMENLMQFLKDEGYLEEETQELKLTIPIGKEVTARKHLLYMLHARSYLLNKMTRHHTFEVSDQLVKTLDAREPDTLETFDELLAQEGNEVTGVAFDGKNVILTFPLSENLEKNRAYGVLAELMVARAKEAKRMSYEPVVQENEKYYLRIWLVQLGLNGTKDKASRSALLKGLAGFSAFRTKGEADRFCEDQKAKRLAAKAAKVEEGSNAISV